MQSLRKISLFVLLFVLLTSCEDSEQSDNNGIVTEPLLGEVDWLKTYGGSDEETAHAVIETSDGGLAVLGFTKSLDGDVMGKSTPVNDFWLLKLDGEGNMEWQNTYGGSDDDRGRDIIQTMDGGYAIAGYSKSSDGDASNNEGQHDNWILKLDATGTVQWEKSFGFSGHDHLYSILQTDDGGYFLGGFLDVTESNGEGNTGKKGISTSHGVGEFWGQKLDSNGNLQWRRYFGGTNNDRIHKVLQAEDGGFVLVGFTESDDFDITNTNGSYDFWVVKINAQGEMAWQETYGGSGLDIAYGAAKTHDNGYVIAGQTISTDGDVTNSNGESDFWVIKINDTGNMVWQKTYGGTDFEAAWSIAASLDKGFVIAGNSKSTDNDLSSNKGENDFWILKIDQNGNLLHELNIGGSGLDFAYGVTATSDGKIIAVGDTESTDQDIMTNKGKKDVLIAKIK
ncbi:hypothetical protein ABN763_06960 [Spongiivirga sp. MCCC 1A20706]|uniref:hypothetical protein n=1 Tax=Spongiivirga sp. MCCC 1A20706 TaxID=3160963 RepID=UPI003977BBB2